MVCQDPGDCQALLTLSVPILSHHQNCFLKILGFELRALQLSQAPRPFAFSFCFFPDGVSCFCLVTSDLDLPTSVSLVAGITGVTTKPDPSRFPETQL
jgi:hypothetical protein